MCGIVGIVSNKAVSEVLISTLQGLQHRGQHAAGAALMNGKQLSIKKGNGLVKEIFGPRGIAKLKGNVGIAHVRYPTSGGEEDPEAAQPFYVNSPFGIVLAHNGNLTNIEKLRHEVTNINHRHLITQSDSELMTNILAYELETLTTNNALSDTQIFQAIKNLNKRITGGYAVTFLIAGYGLVAFRDPLGIRPLILASKVLKDGFLSYAVASESCTLEINGYTIIRDVLPGEAIILKADASITTQICADNPSLNICLFEYVYLARPDSIMENVSIQQARLLMGQKLAQQIQELYPELNIDAIIPIPDTSRTIAIGVAEGLNLPYREGFVKNQFVGRTFIMSDPEQRKIAVRNKLSPIAVEYKDKNVLLVDDSIVRGTTSREIISVIRACGAKKIYIASAAPEVRHPNIYGIDMPTFEELIAHDKNADEIAEAIGADKAIFQTLTNLKSCITELNPEIVNFEASCFDGNYIA